MNHIAYCFDKSYSQHACVSLRSLSMHNRNFQLWLIHDGLEERAQTFILDLADRVGFSVRQIRVDKRTFSDLVLREGLTNATYYRLLLPKLIPQSVKRIVYLDADLVVRSRLDALFRMDPYGKFLSAVEDAGYKGQLLPLSDEHTPYFNAGVMSIDLDMWRSHRIAERACKFVADNPDIIRFSDQCGLNAVINGRWCPLPPKFNVQAFHFKKKYGNKIYSDGEIRNAMKMPAIIHYSEIKKPWTYLCRHPYKSVYWEHLKATPYAGYTVGDRNFKNFLRKWLPLRIKRWAKSLSDTLLRQ
jgi:lipopolysaccharide biosynthesis glycosyltransferase